MDPSRPNSPSPVQSASELYDHRNQPDSLPVRGASFSGSTTSDGLPSAPIFVTTGASGSGGRTVRSRINSFSAESAILDNDYDAEAEDEEPAPLRRRLSSLRAAPVLVDTNGSAARAEESNRFDFSSPAGLHRHQSNISVNASGGAGRTRRQRRTSNEYVNTRRPTFALETPTANETHLASPTAPHRPSVDSTKSIPREKEAQTGGAVAAAAAAGSICSSDSEARSRVNSEDETEEDVCFPMQLEHQRINGIDFDEIEEFAASQRLEQWFPSLKRHADNDLGVVGRRMTFSDGGRPTNTEMLGAAGDIHRGAGVASSSSTTAVLSSGSTSSDEKGGFVAEQVEILKSRTLPPEVAAQLANAEDRFSLFCSESEETIHAPEVCLLTAPEQTFADLFDRRNGTWWLDCLDPTDAEMKMLAKTFGIHPLTTEDIRVQETREKVELFKSYYFVCFRTFEHEKHSEEFLEPLNMYMIVFRDGILSFHFSPFDHTANVRRRIRQLRDYVTVSADWICYALIDDITDGFAPVIHEIEQEADGIEDAVFVARESDFGNMLKRIGEARKKVMTLMRLLSGKADVIKMFAKRCNEQWDVAPKGEIGLYLGDIQDHIVTMYQNLSAYEKILSRSHANYLAQLQVESFHANNRVTNMLSKVTLLGTILVPLNLITGLFGMNVRVPGEGADTFGWFFGIVGVIACIVCVAFFMARRWLGLMSDSNEIPQAEVERRLINNVA